MTCIPKTLLALLCVLLPWGALDGLRSISSRPDAENGQALYCKNISAVVPRLGPSFDQDSGCRSGPKLSWYTSRRCQYLLVAKLLDIF